MLPSPWRYEWWCSILSSHLGLQECKTTWIFPYQDSHAPEINYAIWINFLPYQTSLPVHKGIDKEWETQIFYCVKDDISYHLPWQQRKICCLYRRRHSWYLPLSRYYLSSNHIDHFRSAISSFLPFIFQKQWCSNSPASYCRSLHETEIYLWMLWKNWTQCRCMHHPWSKIPPTKS